MSTFASLLVLTYLVQIAVIFKNRDALAGEIISPGEGVAGAPIIAQGGSADGYQRL